MDQPVDARQVTPVSVPDAGEGTICPLGDQLDLLLRLDVHHDDAQVRRVVGAFTLSLVAGIAGPRFNGAYLFVCDADGTELPEQPLDGRPLLVGIRSMGTPNPTGELLDKVATALAAMLRHTCTVAGLEADVEVTRPAA